MRKRPVFVTSSLDRSRPRPSREPGRAPASASSSDARRQVQAGSALEAGLRRAPGAARRDRDGYFS